MLVSGAFSHTDSFMIRAAGALAGCTHVGLILPKPYRGGFVFRRRSFHAPLSRQSLEAFSAAKLEVGLDEAILGAPRNKRQSLEEKAGVDPKVTSDQKGPQARLLDASKLV